MSNVGGFNDLSFTIPGGPTIEIGNNVAATCSLCHGFPHAGSELVLPPQRDIGVGGHAAAGRFNGPKAGSDTTGGTGPAPAKDMPIFKITCNAGKEHPFYGSEITTNDPGSGLITGKCSDIGKSTVPALRGLASRAPFFHDGSARDLNGVVNFYNQRFSISLTSQEKSDLVNFLAAL
jgi:cytochrome c peroxidase